MKYNCQRRQVSIRTLSIKLIHLLLDEVLKVFNFQHISQLLYYKGVVLEHGMEHSFMTLNINYYLVLKSSFLILGSIEKMTIKGIVGSLSFVPGSWTQILSPKSRQMFTVTTVTSYSIVDTFFPPIHFTIIVFRRLR